MMGQSKITAIFTCFNRKNKTVNCMRTLVNGNRNCQFTFIVVDDNSSDGTEEAIKTLGYDLVYIKGDGKLFWAGGMRKGISFFLNEGKAFDADYVLLVNDDVDFFPESIDKMVEKAKKMPNAAIVGNCCGSRGDLSYGAIKFRKSGCSFKRYHLGIENADVNADTFNCNCVLLPAQMLRDAGNFDEHYTHSFADYDYGMLLRRNNYEIFGTDFYVGQCDDDNLTATNIWSNPYMKRMERLKKKEHPKGLPFKEHFHYLYKNFGLLWALRYVFTPYFRILLKK